MAMYYYASKLNEASCGTCPVRVNEVPPVTLEPPSLPPTTELAPLSTDPVLMPGSGLSYYDDDYFSMVRASNFRTETHCEHFVMNGSLNFVNAQSNAQQLPAVITPTVRTLPAQLDLEPAEVEYNDGRIVSASIEGLVDLLRPGVGQSFTFTFLLCSRLFIKPHELLIKLCKKYAKYIDKLAGASPDAQESPEREEADMGNLVRLLSQWMHMFPYDFRDDRVMALVRSITQRCASEHMDSLLQQVSSMLEKLLDKLTALEQYEIKCKEVWIVSTAEELSQADIITLGLTPAELAHQLTIVELQRLSFIGPEEFVQAFTPTPPPPRGPPQKIPPPVKMTLPSRATTSGKPTKNTISLHHGEKTTRNLEAYADWFNRLSYLVATDVLKAPKSKYRARVIEQWVMTARECFNLGNFNSMMSIISALNMVPVARLKKTWARTSTVCGQQLRQLELCIEPSANHARYRAALAAAPTETAVPLLSVTCRDLHFTNQGAPSKVGGGRINFEKCTQLARHVCVQLASRRLAGEGAPVPAPAHPHPPAWRYLNETRVLNENALELMSFEREPPVDSMEKERLKRLREGI